MNSEIELRKWLCRSDKTFIENLEFGIKVWNSIEFVLLTKTEIIIDEFCNNLPKLRAEVKKSVNAAEHASNAWQKINEFLSLHYAAGAVSVGVKEKLINTLSAEARSKWSRKNPSVAVMRALLTTLHSSSMQNYYKSNTSDYAKFIGTNLSYFTTILFSEETGSIDDEQQRALKEIFEAILNELKTFIKQTPSLDAFKSAFSRHIVQQLCEIVISLKSRRIDYASELFAILQELYFDYSQTDKLKKYLQKPSAADATGFCEIFDVPMHVFMIVVETILIAHRNDSELQKCFFAYLVNDKTGKLRTTTAEVSDKLLLQCLTLFMQLLRKHEVPLSFEFDSLKAITYLGKRIEAIVNEHQAAYMYEVLSLVCATLKLNPMILEHTACQIAVKFMVVAKTEEHVWRKYEQLMFLLIEMYRKLSRAEKFVAQLIRNLYETLTSVKLSKKLKRTFNADFVEPVVTPPKRIKADDSEIGVVESPKNDAKIDFVDLLIRNFDSDADGEKDAKITQRAVAAQSWNDIAFAFPPTISQTYTRFISGLISKPSLVVWKTLVFTLKDYVRQLHDSDGKCSENTIFLIEISSALLSQYFMGSRLAEQADKTWKSIEENRQLTYDVLADFGRAILNQEHNYRTMNAFLKLSYNVTNFDLTTWYYCPDSMSGEHESDLPQIDGAKCVQNIHSYLAPKEWTIIEQRITNFGKRECKSNINKIYLQRLKAAQLFGSAQKDATIDKFILSTTFDDTEQLTAILADETVSTWFVANLDATQKRTVCERLLQSPQQLDVFYRISLADREFVDILILSIYKCIVDVLASCKKGVYLTEIEFEKCFGGEYGAIGGQLSDVIEKIVKQKMVGDKQLIENFRDDISEYLRLLVHLPIGFSNTDLKNVLFSLNLVVYRNLLATDNDQLRLQTIRLLKTLLHFDEMPAIFSSLRIKTLISVFSAEPVAPSIYDMIFNRIVKDLNETNLKMLDDLQSLLTKFEKVDAEQQQTILDIAVFAVVNLSKNKKNKEHYDRLRVPLFDIIRSSVANKDAESSKKCIEKTLPAFATIVKTMVARNETDDGVAAIFKLFMKNTVDCTNSYTIKLLNVAVSNKSTLKYADDELKELIELYWTDFKRMCAESTAKGSDGVLKTIFDFKTTDEWIALLSELETDIKESLFTERADQQNRILASMAKCQLNKVKGQIFSEFFKKIAYFIRFNTRSKTSGLLQNLDTVFHLLECYTFLVNNVQIPASIDLIDDILSFLSEINVKTASVHDLGLKRFVRLLNYMLDLCSSLLNHRHVFLVDRVPHFVVVFKDLLQTICWYKADRSKQVQLDAAEVTMLAEMAHKLEKMNKLFVKHSIEVKRVAPFLLIFVINLMISNDRPTTLYPKIKTHFEYICYDLIASCDHRAESFVLRSCNEASKPVYEILHKEYEKYFKFRGKV